MDISSLADAAKTPPFAGRKIHDVERDLKIWASKEPAPLPGADNATLWVTLQFAKDADQLVTRIRVALAADDRTNAVAHARALLEITALGSFHLAGMATMSGDGLEEQPPNGVDDRADSDRRPEVLRYLFKLDDQYQARLVAAWSAFDIAFNALKVLGATDAATTAQESISVRKNYVFLSTFAAQPQEQARRVSNACLGAIWQSRFLLEHYDRYWSRITKRGSEP